jgi:succinate dehydrogenase / fumarate reductase membrane anchor subunit
MAMFQTPRKRAQHLGAAGGGTEHYWHNLLSSVALLFLVPAFVVIFGVTLGRPHAEVVAILAQPFVAIVVALTLVVGLYHLRLGLQVLFEDYLRGLARKLAIVAAVLISYATMAVGLFAVARLAL